MSENLEQIRYLAANYSRLQGLRSVPVGIFVALTGIWVALPAGQDGDLAVPLLLMLAGAVAYFLVDRYYARSFGQVYASSKNRMRETVFSLLFGLLAFGAFLLDSAEIMPINAFGLVFGIGLFLDTARPAFSWKETPESFVMLGLMVIASLIPGLGLAWWQWFGIQVPLAGMLLLAGILIMATGIIGHLRLSRTLAKIQEGLHA
jgi:hypothetical protein